MAGILSRYTKWLHTQWPAGTVEKLPVSGAGGVTALPGVRIVGDLTGIPLLKFSSHPGAGAGRGEGDSEGGRRKAERGTGRTGSRDNRGGSGGDFSGD